MKFLNKTLLVSILVFSSIMTSLMGGSVTKYIPIISDDFITFLPQKTGYEPPLNSLEHTTIVTTNGKKIRVDRTPEGLVFEGYIGKIVLLEVYGHSCPHCQRAIPHYNTLKKRYPKDVYVITIESYGLTNTELKQYVKSQHIAYDTVSKNNSGKMLSFIRTLIKRTPPGVPYLVILSQSGDFIEYKFLPEFDYIDGQIKALL